MNAKIIKFKLLEMPPRNMYGLRRGKSKLFIGDSNVKITGNRLKIKSYDFLLTEGLFNLLSQDKCSEFTEKDLNYYKSILLLTNAHRHGFDPKQKIISSKSWKYKNVISKLFPPQRKRYFKKVVKQEPCTTPQSQSLCSLKDISDSVC
jgi:hypothetical protein